MTRHASSETTKIEKVRQWLREERNSRGWSANRLAKEAKISAEARGKISDIKYLHLRMDRQKVSRNG